MEWTSDQGILSAYSKKEVSSETAPPTSVVGRLFKNGE